jgi:hypothetical protein
MSVRAWFTISAAVLVVLAVAFVLRFFAPVPAPEIVGRVGSIRLSGQRLSTCWPQRNGRLRCEHQAFRWQRPVTLRGTGTIHLVVAYPVQPPGGSVRIERRDHSAVSTSKWTESCGYRLDPGQYVLRATAAYPHNATTDYAFAITVTSSGS